MIIDAHAHLDHYATGRELRGVLQEMERDRILTVSVAMDADSYERTKKLARGYPTVIPAFGIHPWEAAKHQRHLESFQPLIEETPLIGEIGLDHRFVKDLDLYPSQRRVFAFFLAAARAQDKIVNVHTSGAEDDVLRAFEEHDVRRAIVHWYNGPLDIFRQFAARGCYFTFGVELPHSAHIQALARECPADLILTETDNPGGQKFLTGEMGRPRVIGRVIRALAEARGTSPAEVVTQVRENFLRLIGDDARLASIRELLAKG
jgi:TatD DNase family protein